MRRREVIKHLTGLALAEVPAIVMGQPTRKPKIGYILTSFDARTSIWRAFSWACALAGFKAGRNYDFEIRIRRA